MHGLNSKAHVTSQPVRGLTRRLIFRCSPRSLGSDHLLSLFTSPPVSQVRFAAPPSVSLIRFIVVEFRAGYHPGALGHARISQSQLDLFSGLPFARFMVGSK